MLLYINGNNCPSRRHAIISTHTPNIDVPNFIKQTLVNIKNPRGHNTIM